MCGYIVVDHRPVLNLSSEQVLLFAKAKYSASHSNEKGSASSKNW